MKAGNSSGETQEHTWKLNNEPLLDNQDQWEQLAEKLDLQPPHYYSGNKAEKNWRAQFDRNILSTCLHFSRN